MKHRLVGQLGTALFLHQVVDAVSNGTPRAVETSAPAPAVLPMSPVDMMQAQSEAIAARVKAQEPPKEPKEKAEPKFSGIPDGTHLKKGDDGHYYLHVPPIRLDEGSVSDSGKTINYNVFNVGTGVRNKHGEEIRFSGRIGAAHKAPVSGETLDI